MGQPAARIGDQTAHGGVITGPGEPTVLIGGKPASVMGDMHTCPMQTPAAPSPIPHVGGPIIKGSVGVLIGGKPAARVNDMATCTGPPDTIVMGCVTVLIGETGGGGGGGAGGGAGRASGAAESAEVEEVHFLNVKFVDPGGKPIVGVDYAIEGPDSRIETGALNGKIKKTGVEEGDYKITLKAITSAKWSTDSAKVGDKVKLSAKTSGIKDDEPATFDIFIKDPNFADKGLCSLETNVSGDQVEVEWEFKVDEDLLKVQDGREEQGGYSNPSFYFTITAAGCKSRSGYLTFADTLELKLVDQEGNAASDVKYKIELPSGEVKKGTLDSQGQAKVEGIPPGKGRVTYDLDDKNE